MIETPDTSMSIQPDDPIFSTQPPNTDENVTADPNYTPPPAPVSPNDPETVSTYEGPVGVTGIFNGNITTGCSYDPLSHNEHRAIDDIVVPGSVGKYPLKMARYYNSRQQYSALTAIGLGPGWSHEYSWLLWGAGSKVVSPHGNVCDFYCPGGPPLGVSDGWDDGVQGPHPSGGTWRLSDGGKVVLSGGHATDIYDPYGLRTRIAYNTSGSQIGERVKVTEPGGRCLWFIYGDRNQGNGWGDGTWLLTRVEAYDSDGSPGSPTHPNGNLIDWVNYTYQAYDPVDPSNPGNRQQKMLIRVDYPNSTNNLNDNTHAHYDYRIDNVHEGGTTHKLYPLLKRCDDVRFKGPMRSIILEYQNSYPHGFIADEYCPGTGAVSAISPTGPDMFTETRGDGPTRSFTYTHIHHCTGPDCGPCDDYGTNGPNQQMLLSYTDFQGQTTQIGYDQTSWYITSVQDANHNTTYYEHNAGLGAITKITHPGDGSSYIQYGYETETGALGGHYIHTIRDENNKTTTITRDPAHHWITRIDYPSDANTPASYEEFLQYNSFGQFTVHHMRNGAYETFVYDGRGLLTDKYNPKSTQPGGADPHTHYDYYTSGGWIDRVKTVTMPANFPMGYQATETYEYDIDSASQPCAGRGLVTKITHADTHYQAFRYDQWGNKLHEWNELGERTDYFYDGYNRVTSVTRVMTPGPNETTAYTYKPTNGNGTSPFLHTTSNPDTVTSPTLIMTSNVYDQNFRKTSANVAGRTTWFHYDPVGNQDCVTDPRGTGPCSSGYTTTTQYDVRNRKWKVWDAQGNLTTFTYDGASNITRIDRPDSNWETKTYDAVNRVLTDTLSFVGGGSPINLTTWFKYNPSGTIWKVTDARGSGPGDPNYTTSFFYDASDRRSYISYPNGQTQSWGYDQAGNVFSRLTVGGSLKYLYYDQRNRQYGESWLDQTEWRGFELDAAGRLRRAANGPGLWYDGTALTSDVHRTYDTAGRLKLDQQPLQTSPWAWLPRDVNYIYNADGKETQVYVTDGSGYNYKFGYDAMGRFETIKSTADNNLLFQYYYDDASNVQRRHNQVTGVDESYNPNNLNQVAGVDLQMNGSSAHEAYAYYPSGRLHTVTRGNKQDQFGYYLDGELWWVMYGVPSGVAGPDPNYTPPADDPSKEKTPEDFLSLSGWDPNLALTADRTVNYGLDNAGNRNFVSDSAVGTVYYTPNNLNQYTGNIGSDSVSNGSEHQVASYKNVNYTYVKDEHLIGVSSGPNSYALVYDALGRCIKRTVNGVTKYYVYDGEKPILEYKSNGTYITRNVYGKGIDEILMRYDSTLLQNQTFYYQQDHEGSVIYLTKPDGTVLENYRYDVFGTPTIYDGNGTVRTASIVSNRFLFTGREWSAMFGFYEYRARAYHPLLGRFMSEDPRLFDAGDYNLFRYCHNDPIDLTDPMGLEELEIQFRAFIPQASVGIYSGDNRGFSSDRNASSRVAVSITIETDPARNGGRPLVGHPSYSVQSTHNNLTGRDSISNGPQTPKVDATRDSKGNTIVNIQMNMRNPEQKVLGHGVGQGIKSDVNISVDQKATKASVDGTVSRSPAFEANFIRQDGETTNAPLQNAARNPVDFIINLQKNEEIHHPLLLPPRNNQ